ncbi:MAG: hypothetical protein U5L01_10685 [Rheinheimera sp.]|mgnify:CR=1 FL=1|jgi:hypothetical protein|nr:hypothetical protein [Gammaproteobacteria bacterium]MDZ7902965.1 hypothetical protein [Rheinheimera sp.]
MWVFLAFLALLAVIIVLMMKIDTLAREHKRFIVQCRLMESESSHVQHITFDMAEEFSVNLQQQLQLARRTTRVTEAEVLLFEFCIQSIPAVCKELSRRQQSLAQAMARVVQLNGIIDMQQLDTCINRHGRLIPAWQRNNFAGYLQLCQQMVALMREHSTKEHRSSSLSEPA